MDRGLFASLPLPQMHYFLEAVGPFGGGVRGLGGEVGYGHGGRAQAILLFHGIVMMLFASIFFIGYSLNITLFVIVFYRFITKTHGWVAIMGGLAGMGFISLISKLLVID